MGAFVDPRVEQYARLLVERSLDVQPGWQVMVVATPAARPLVEELVRQIGRKGAWPLVRLSYVDQEQVPFDSLWATEAPEDLLATMAPSEARTREELDAWLLVFGSENTRGGTILASERRQKLRQASMGFTRRRLMGELPWVGCLYPTEALAQDAGMTLADYADFVFGACLLDWEAERERMIRYQERFDGADSVRIVGPGTDLTLSIAGRTGLVDDAHYNMPGGEFFYSPLEDSADGVVEFSEFPAVYQGAACDGVRLRFEGGKVVEASATSNEDFLLGALDTDDGARRVGELGIGCNPGIQRHTRNTLFDEKIDGTVHLAVGAGVPMVGGTNHSAVHWDMVKDLRSAGRVELDGEVVQENGVWALS
jgi:aminopeptidase